MTQVTSTKRYREEALALQARTDLRPVDRARLLEMLRIECSLIRRANKGDPFPDDLEPVKVELKPPSQNYLERRAFFDGHTRPDVRAKQSAAGKASYPKMMAVLARRREKVERSRLRQLARQIERQIEALM